MTGKFIVIEGLEGAGKSSVIAAIEAYLTAQSIVTEKTREPGGTPLAEAIRDCVKHPWDEHVTEQTELLLMYASRSQLVENVIRPALMDGKWVIADRHDLSTVAYQGGGRQIPLQNLSTLRELTLGDFSPDFTVFLDVSVELGLSRARGRGKLDRIEMAGFEFFQRVRDMYLFQLSLMPNSVIIDASAPMEIVHRDTIDALSRWMSQ